MKVNLLEGLTQVQDFRAPRGRRYPLWLLLLLVIMGTISGCLGYRALEDFCHRHHDALVASLQLPPTRLPSDSTFRRVMMGNELALLFKGEEILLPLGFGEGWGGVSRIYARGLMTRWDDH